MIKVVYHRNYHRLTVEGHAHSGEPGHDLVCAAASALAYTLAGNVANMAVNGQVRSPSLEMESGKAEISCNPVSHLKNTVTLVFDAVCVGFELLAEQYKEYIKYEIMH